MRDQMGLGLAPHFSPKLRDTGNLIQVDSTPGGDLDIYLKHEKQ
jgi:hypothetical protein